MVTMKDIAFRAGVTRSAVSAVINGTTASRVSVKKREKILKICRELNYRRNFAATALKESKTSLLGFACCGLQVPFLSELTMAMTTEAAKRGYNIIFSIIEHDQLNKKSLDKVLTSMCDGVFLCREIKEEEHELQRQVENSGIPFIMLESELNNISSVSFDYQVGMRRAFEELLENGHQKIAFAGHPGDIHKWDAYHDCCNIYKTKPVDYYFKWDNNFTTALECGKQIAESKNLHTALITTDFTLSMLTGSIHAAGVNIPEDLSVIAFNDTVQSRFFRPPLTSIALDTKAMANRAMDIMLELIKDKNMTRVKSVLISPELVRRESVRSINNLQEKYNIS